MERREENTLHLQGRHLRKGVPVYTHCYHQVVENGDVILSGGYVDLTVDSDHSSSHSNSNEQILKVRSNGV